MSSCHGSVYSVPDDAVGDARVYGRFEGQRILGSPCVITVERLDDGDPRALDLLRVPGFRRVGAAIHISGLDPFGQRTGPGFIRALGLYSIDWHGREEHPGGLGCAEPEPVAILTWDGDAGGTYHRRDDWQHHVHYGACGSVLTLQALADLFDDTFGPEDVCRRADEIQGRSRCLTYCEPQHIRAVRRLLDTHVGVQNNHIQPRATLRRASRWAYRWERSQ